MLEVIEITKYFEKKKKIITALDNVSFEIKEGEIVGLLGPNGSGKTTLMNLMIGFYLPDRGDILFEGKSIFKHPELVRKYIRIPYLLEDPRFSVWEVLMLTAKFFGVKDWKEKIEYWLEFFDIKNDRDTQIQKLSSGNHRKVEIIGALLSEPKLLLLDEITNGLDLMSVEKLIETLKKVNKRYKTSIIFASHIFDHVKKLCPRVIILYKGKVLADGKVKDLIKKAKLKEYITLKTVEELPEDIFQVLNKSFNVVKVDSNTYKIVTDDSSKELKKLARFLAENPTIDRYIQDISLRKVDLEDVFAYFVEKATYQ